MRPTPAPAIAPAIAPRLALRLAPRLAPRLAGCVAAALLLTPIAGAQDVVLVEQERAIVAEGAKGASQSETSAAAGLFERAVSGPAAQVEQASIIATDQLLFTTFAVTFDAPDGAASSRLTSVFDVVDDATNAQCAFDYALERGGEIASTTMRATLVVERFTADEVWVTLAAFGESIEGGDQASATDAIGGVVVPLAIGRHRVRIDVETASDAVDAAEVVANVTARVDFVAGPAVCGDPELGSCFDPRDVPGCSDADCCAIVCGVDAFCCDTQWDDFCADLALDRCDGCGESADSCLVPHADVSCADPVCCSIVCSADGFCCDTAWDESCVEQARVLCLACPAEGGADLNGDGVVSGADLTILLDGWGTAGCTDVTNDGLTDGQDLLEVIANWTPV